MIFWLYIYIHRLTGEDFRALFVNILVGIYVQNIYPVKCINCWRICGNYFLAIKSTRMEIKRQFIALRAVTSFLFGCNLKYVSYNTANQPLKFNLVRYVAVLCNKFEFFYLKMQTKKKKNVRLPITASKCCLYFPFLKNSSRPEWWISFSVWLLFE